MSQHTRHGNLERGSATIEAVIGVPAFLLFVLLIIAAGRIAIARQAVEASAAEAARSASIARTEHQAKANGTSGAAATSFIAAAGGSDVLENASVSGSRSATQATVTVHGAALSVIPGWSPSVQQSATVPVERITTG